MKSVLISIRPQWCEKIANEKKTIEVRKTRPKLEPPFKCYIYCTKDGRNPLAYSDYCGYDMTDFSKDFLANGQVIGEFVCDRILHWQYYWMPSVTHICDMSEMSCVPVDELLEYAGEKKLLYGWHISNLKIYDKPKGLREFGLNRAPQSWCYVEGGEG